MLIFEIIQIFAATFLALLSVRALFLVAFSYKNYSRKLKINKSFRPFVSIIVPCYNEELTLDNCIKGLLNQSYDNYEILIVNDGSKDNTKAVGKGLEKEHHGKIRFLDKPNGGKASALNYGIERAKGSIIISIDADSIFVNDTVVQLVAPFEDPKVDAVTGNVRVSNTNNLLTKSQSIEYLTGLNLEKRTFTELNCIQVISGCIGAFRKERLLDAGGYSSDTLIEDMDLTVTMAKRGCKIVYNPHAIAYTEAPETLGDLYKQRYRWGYGKWQVIKKHKDIILNKEYGSIGTIGIPYFLVALWINILTAIIMGGLLVSAIISNHLISYISVLLVFSIPVLVIFCYVLYIDRNKDSNTLPLYVIIQILYYPFVIMYCDVKAWIDFKRGVKTNWNKLKRLGLNLIPANSTTKVIVSKDQHAA